MEWPAHSEKSKLMEAAHRHETEIEEEVKSMTDHTGKIIKNALIIGGSLALAYWLYSSLTSSRSKPAKSAVEGTAPQPPETAVGAPAAPGNIEKAETMVIQAVGKKVINTLTLILLDVAKDKISEYLQRRKNEHS